MLAGEVALSTSYASTATMTAAALRARFAHATMRLVRHVAPARCNGTAGGGDRRDGRGEAAASRRVRRRRDALAWTARGELDAIAKLQITKLSLSGGRLEHRSD